MWSDVAIFAVKRGLSSEIGSLETTSVAKA